MKNENANGNRDQWHPDKEIIAQITPSLIDDARLHLANQIARRAYFLYLEDGAQHGHDLAHWLQAESELFEERNDAAPRQGPLSTKAQRQGVAQGPGIVL